MFVTIHVEIPSPVNVPDDLNEILAANHIVGEEGTSRLRRMVDRALSPSTCGESEDLTNGHGQVCGTIFVSNASRLGGDVDLALRVLTVCKAMDSVGWHNGGKDLHEAACRLLSGKLKP